MFQAPWKVRREEQLKLAAQSDLATSRNGGLAATVSFYRALGGGWNQ